MPVLVSPITFFELSLSALTTIIVLESGRRTIGWVFPILTALFLVYSIWGHYIPGRYGHPYIPTSTILQYLYLSPNGIWGFMTGLSATYIALFVVFGSLLLHTGGGKTFIDLALLIAGRFRGGPAKVAVVASGFFAMMSGSPMANVATTGSFTIPLMKKLGYSSHFAGGVESAASSGGILTPPIMGGAAFIMAEFLGIPYLKVITAAAIPAFLFYLTAFMGVHFQSVKLNLKPVPKPELPPLKSTVTVSRMLGLVLPIATLLYLLVRGYSLSLVASSACMVILVTYVFSDFSLHNIKKRLLGLPSILEAAGKTVIGLVPILVSANIVLFLLNFTGLDLKFSNTVMGLGRASTFMSLLMTGILVMILGTGLPTTAAYVLGILVAAPMLKSWGLLPLASHLFILYYSLLATITPPVCPTVFVAIGIAESDWLKTAWVAIRLAPLLYLMPFLFVFDNSFLLLGPVWPIILKIVTATAGAVVLSSGTMGYLLTKCNIIERLVLVASGLLLLLPGWQTDLIGIAIVIVMAGKQLWSKKGLVAKKTN
jgi:TRAP transporter 4TM/12TM fusion protein